MNLHRRLLILVILLWIGFGLRLHNSLAGDLNIDETWSYLHGYYLAFPDGYSAFQILAPEPNNALHLLLLALNFRFLPGELGARWLSIAVGTITIALAARIAFRLFGRRAALIAAVLMVGAYAPLTFSQIARPYALATMLASLSLLLWLENKRRWNMVVSTLVPLAHLGAMPVVFTQDLLTAWKIVRGRRVRKGDWIFRRIPVYTMFVLIIYLVYVRRDIHIISSGQAPPTPTQVVAHMISVVHPGFPELTADMVLFLVGVIFPIGLIVFWRRRQLSKGLSIPLLWIVVTYGFLIAGAVLSDGPIKWAHISHVAIALIVIMAGVLSQARRSLVVAILGTYGVAAAIAIQMFYQHPYDEWSRVRNQIDRLRRGDEAVFLQQATVLWALQLNNPTAQYIAPLPEEGLRPSTYLYVEYKDWPPEAPSDCARDPVWEDTFGLRALTCSTDNSG